MYHPYVQIWQLQRSMQKWSGLPHKPQSLFKTPAMNANNIPPSLALHRPRISKNCPDKPTDQTSTVYQFGARACTGADHQRIKSTVQYSAVHQADGVVGVGLGEALLVAA